MPTYAGVTFEVEAPQPFTPYWTPQQYSSSRHIPGSNRDDVQGLGRGNFKISVEVTLPTAGDLVTLQMAADSVTKRTLGEFYDNDDVSNVVLRAVRSVSRLITGAEYKATLDFEYEG